MGNFTREECVHTNFQKKDVSTITFSNNNDSRNITISIPFADDTPQSIKDKLDNSLWELMNNALEKQGYFGCMYRPHICCLDVQMQVIYDYELGAQYYLVVDVSEAEGYRDNYINERIYISTQEHELYNDFTAYCRYKLDKILFPIW